MFRQDHPALSGRPGFTQYHASHSPFHGHRLSPHPGDIFVNTQDLKVWYYTDEWIQWTKISKDARHPKYQDRVLVPEMTGLQWTHASLFLDATIRAKTWLGPKVNVRNVARSLLGNYSTATVQLSDSHGQLVSTIRLDVPHLQ
jgi:hypothetical protein